MKTIRISSTSFLLPSNSSWDKFKSKYKLKFSEYGNIAKFNNDKDKSFCEVLNIFIPDLIDFSNDNLKISKKKITSISNLIERKAQLYNVNYIIAVSEFYFTNIVENSKNLTILKKMKNFLLSNLYKLSKKYKNIFIVDLDDIFSNIGYQNCFDNRNYSLFRCRLSTTGIGILSQNLIDLIDRLIATNKKVLLLDCDNTLWGGVLSEDGMYNLQIGQDGIGIAYLNFQKAIKKLKNNGILIVLVSKNEISDVKNLLKKNKSMILKERDITAFKVNWSDKSKNIYDLSNDLMLGLDSFVFWDDNPIEREKVKQKLKDVIVIEPKEDVSDWAKQLLEYKGFSKFASTKEDLNKTQQYKNREKFVSDKKNYKDEMKYLKSINLKPKIHFLQNTNIDRAVQLSKKTNQFNFNNTEYSHAKIKEFAKKNICFLVSLKDNYGDHGLIALVCAKIINKKNLYIENFLMSCRILGRYLEYSIINELKKISKKNKLKNIIFQFIPTKKNQPVTNFILESGLKKLSIIEAEKMSLPKKKCAYYLQDVNKKIPFVEIYEK